MVPGGVAPALPPCPGSIREDLLVPYFAMKIALLALAPCLAPLPITTPQDTAAEDFPAVPFARSVERPNHLTPLEAKAGWQLLFDGLTTEGWVERGQDAAPAGWVVADGCLHRAEPTKDLFSAMEFGDFELTFEWRVAPGVNSGLKYRLDGVGPEYQILDDATDEAKNKKHAASALYDVVPPAGSRPVPPGEFNRARIVARGNHIEHWLNGVRVVQVEVGSAEWKDAVEKSKFKSVADFAAPKRSPLMLQEHGGAVWYRSLKIREFDKLPGEEVVLFDGEKIEGWRALGDAIYEADEGSILGRIGGGGQSFLVTERTFGDFLLEVDLKNELPGNSGIQVRSHQRENGRTFGYQIEIDASDRAWSAGLYDEARRGWLQNLVGNEPGRRAFRNGDWNTYRIECVGPWIRVWLNGVPTVDYFDTADLEGVLGLQVHSGNNTRVRWRNFRMRDLGQCRWVEIPAGADYEQNPLPPFRTVAMPDADYAVRARYRSNTGKGWIVDRQPGVFLFEEPPAPELDPLLIQRNGWALALGDADAKHLRPGDWNELTVCCFGGRTVVHVNGQKIREFRPSTWSGAHEVEIRAPRGATGNFEFQSIERLEW